MKLVTYIWTLFLLISCNNQKPINYSKINGIENINEQVITDLYKNVLDTLIGDCYFVSKPILETDLIDKTHRFSGVSKQDQDFFNEQIDKFQSLRWENLTTNEKILIDSEMDTLFNQGALRGWEIFRKKYGYGCICSISIPLFTKDCKRVYIDYAQLHAADWGHGEIIVFELINNKWILKQRYGTWIS